MVVMDSINSSYERFWTLLERELDEEDLAQYQKLLKVICPGLNRSNGDKGTIVEVVHAFYKTWSAAWSLFCGFVGDVKFVGRLHVLSDLVT